MKRRASTVLTQEDIKSTKRRRMGSWTLPGGKPSTSASEPNSLMSAVVTLDSTLPSNNVEDEDDPMSQVEYYDQPSSANLDHSTTSVPVETSNTHTLQQGQTTEEHDHYNNLDDDYMESPVDDRRFVPLRNVPVDKASAWALTWVKDIPCAEVYYQPQFVDERTALEWYDALMCLDTWYNPTLTVYGKPHRQPRQISAYTTSPNLSASYSNHTLTLHHPYPPLLSHIQSLISSLLGVNFDHVMLNRYDNGGIGISKHRDTKDNQVIASLSLGAEREFILSPFVSKSKSKVGKWGNEDCGDVKWKLGNGSLLVMQGDTQKYWRHEIPKEPHVTKGRISLTFRQLVHD